MDVGGQAVGLQVWDTAGQERFLSLGAAFYKGSDCCILVFDVTEPESFNHIADWKKEFLERNAAKDDNFPFVVIGNKIDKESSRKVSAEKAKMWCKTNGNLLYFETSAKDGTSVTDAFKEVANIAFKNRKSSVYYPHFNSI